MGTASTIRLTKPRISVIVLESTAALVSAVLVIWLLLWFVHQKASRNPIEAFLVQADGIPAEEVPLQAADVRLLSGTVQQVGPKELLEKIPERIDRGPALIYISAPMLSTGPASNVGGRPWIKTLIEAVCSTPGREVVLALDLSQVDTDRELGVFGNRVYWELEETVKAVNAATVEERKPKRRLFILTSSAPAQKSWSADGLSPPQSIFAYYLRKGLEGGEKKGQDGQVPRSITIEELHRYVLVHVREWVSRYRGAVQTPMLLTVLPDPKGAPALSLNTLLTSEPAATPRPKNGAGANPVLPAVDSLKAATQGNPGPVAEKTGKDPDPIVDAMPDPLDSRMKALFAEWKTHDALRKERPYRLLPGAWRSYQAALMRTERQLRAAWLDPKEPDALTRVDLGLEKVRTASKLLSEELGQKKMDETHFRFRPVAVAGEDEGKRKLQEALVFVTGRTLDLPELTPAMPPREKVDLPAGEAAKGATPAPPAKEPARDLVPPGLGSVTPEVYLELQLPAWAYQFMAAFQKMDYFKQDNRRRQVLLDLVKARADAELALALDRRGLGWIAPTIKHGDEIRRRLQDEVLSGVQRDEGPNLWKRDVDLVGSTYKRARDRSQKFRAAREIFEEAAETLPILAEWLIRDRSSRLGPSSKVADPIPGEARRALTSFNRLAQLLNDLPPRDDARFDDRAEKWFSDLNHAVEESDGDLKDLIRLFRETINGLGSENQWWVTLDAALRTPLIPVNQRELLLGKLRMFREPAVPLKDGDAKASGGKADRAADPGFWMRAAGLAKLDLTLHQIARDPETLNDTTFGFKELNASWSLAQNDFQSHASSEDGPSQFPDFTAAVREGGKELAEHLELSPETGTTRRRDEIESILPDRDRCARLLDAWKFEEIRKTRSIDEVVESYELFSRYAALQFHFQRLRDDYAEERILAELVRDIAEIATSKAIGVESQPGSLRSQSLLIRTHPNAQLKLMDWKGTLTVEIPPAEEEGNSIPVGQAFVGLVIPKGLDVQGGSSEDRIPGKLVPVGKSADGDQLTSPQSYQLVQEDLGASKPYSVEAKVFYRGRVDKDGVDTVEVVPTESSDLVGVTIGQDPRDWVRKYTEEFAKDIVDQFQVHPHEGYMHLGKSLDYVLTFQNRTPKELHVKCVIELVDPAKPQAKKEEITIFEKPWTLGPRGSGRDKETFSSKVTLGRDRPDDTRELKVSLSPLDQNGQIDPKGPKLHKEPFKVVFRQQTVDDYMSFRTDFRVSCDGHKDKVNRLTSCFIVTFARKKDDKFTEPIRSSEWRCEMLGYRSDSIAAPWIPPDKPYEYHFYDFHANKDCKWSGLVENEDIDGDQKGGGAKRLAPAHP